VAVALARAAELQADAAAGPAAGNDDALSAQFGVAPEKSGPPRAGRGSRVQILPLAGMSHKHLERITQAFLEEAPRRLALARSAVDDGNASAASAAFHALKGSAGYLSSTHLHTLCHEMEDLAASGDLAGVVARLPELVEVLDKACADLSGSDISPSATSGTPLPQPL